MHSAIAQQLQAAGVEVAVQAGTADGGGGVRLEQKLLVLRRRDFLLAHIGRVGDDDVKAAGQHYGGEINAPLHNLGRGGVLHLGTQVGLDFVHPPFQGCLTAGRGRWYRRRCRVAVHC